jgi:hypothetical protein
MLVIEHDRFLQLSNVLLCERQVSSALRNLVWEKKFRQYLYFCLPVKQVSKGSSALKKLAFDFLQLRLERFVTKL